jgi:hypothetical protein
VDTCRGTNPVSRGSGGGEVGPRGEVPVSVVPHPEEKAGDPARGGEKARPGGGFCVSPPLLAPWTRLDRRPWGQDGGLSAPGTPSFAPWDVGVDHEPERVPKAWKSFPPEGGEEVAACALTAWLILVKRGKQRGGFPSRLSIKGPSKRSLEAFPALTSGCPSFAPSGGGGEVLAP